LNTTGSREGLLESLVQHQEKKTGFNYRSLLKRSHFDENRREELQKKKNLNKMKIQIFSRISAEEAQWRRRNSKRLRAPIEAE
jgi:hypothetical protein